MARFTPPLHLPGATEFSAERDVLSSTWFVKTLKQTAWLYRDLQRATALDKNWGRCREPGGWALAYLAFVVSGCVDIEPWWRQSGAELWRECGFAARPSYQRAYERFVELEEVAEEFAAVAGKLIQHCRRHDPLIGCHIHVDGTEAETHAGLLHDCREDEGCDWERQPARRPQRVDSVVARRTRHRESEEAPEEGLQEGSPEAPEEATAEAPEVGEQGSEPGSGAVGGLEERSKRVKINGHWYRTLDTTAGIRAYSGPGGVSRFWHGFNNIKAIDHYTGAPLAVGVYSASLNEHLCYPDVLERVREALGRAPETMIADKGFSVKSVFALNTNLGIASVIPWRKGNHKEQHRHDEAAYDRDGVPRCKHCGSESAFVRFRVERGGPRLWFRCALGYTEACRRDQSLTCSRDWRALVPLWRTDPLYFELLNSHGCYERVHKLWRERYRVAGDHLANRPKRRGRAWQELRAQAALLAEWLCLAWRQGWLGSARRNQRQPERTFQAAGVAAVRRIRLSRAESGLDVPYGAAAEQHALGVRTPPSRRVQAPPGAPVDGGSAVAF